MPSFSREVRLRLLIELLWEQIQNPTASVDAIEHAIRARGMAWAIKDIPEPFDDDEWVNPDQIGHALGYTPSTVRVWAHRYKLSQIDGCYRWGDVKKLNR